jgi:cysteine desulfurase
MIYLDANATTRCTPSVVAAVTEAMAADFANPSSLHSSGNSARFALESARDSVCALLPGVIPESVVFTSGGTEGNNAVIRSFGLANAGLRVITTTVEHPSVLRPAEVVEDVGGKCIALPVSNSGTVSPSDVASALPEARIPVLVTIQWANSETGVIQPISDIIDAVRVHRPDAFIHVDAAQAIGRLPIEIDRLNALTCSGHKLHGPGGTGILLLCDPDEPRLPPLHLGGGQERGRRSGTQNVAGVVGLGVAFRERAVSFGQATQRLLAMRDAFEEDVLTRVPKTKINGAEAPRVPNTTNIRFHGIEATTLVATLDQRGIACSVGSACSSARPQPSSVLTAMGLSKGDAYSSVRFSFSVLNTFDEIGEAVSVVVAAVKELMCK